MNKKLFWICGKHSILAATQNQNRLVKKVACLKKEKFLDKSNIKYILENKKFFQNNFKNISHQYIAALVGNLKIDQLEKKTNLSSVSNIVIFENITDTRNIGNILRSCVLFNIDLVVFDKRNFKQDSVSMIKAASGAIDILKIMTVSNIAGALKILKEKNFWITSLDQNGTVMLKDYNWQKKNVIIFGSENKGINKNTIKNSDYLVKIKTNNKLIDSLNVSNVASITLSSLYNFQN